MTDHLIICPACRVKNRVPVARIEQQARCGKCQTLLLPAQPLDLDDALLSRLIAHETLTLVVDFWAPWCGPCQSMAPVFSAAAAEMSGQFRLAKLDTEAQQVAASRYAIRSIPTLIAFHQGKEIARQSGALPAAQLRQWLQNLPL